MVFAHIWYKVVGVWKKAEKTSGSWERETVTAVCAVGSPRPEAHLSWASKHTKLIQQLFSFVVVMAFFFLQLMIFSCVICTEPVCGSAPCWRMGCSGPVTGRQSSGVDGLSSQSSCSASTDVVDKLLRAYKFSKVKGRKGVPCSQFVGRICRASDTHRPNKLRDMRRLEVWLCALLQVTPQLVRIIQFRRLKSPSKLPST